MVGAKVVGGWVGAAVVVVGAAVVVVGAAVVVVGAAVVGARVVGASVVAGLWIGTYTGTWKRATPW